MKTKIGIFGAAAGVESSSLLNQELIQALLLHRNESIFITGACTGIPNQIANSLALEGTETWGFSPALDAKEHQSFFPELDFSYYSRIFFVPENYRSLFHLDSNSSTHLDKLIRFKYRNVLSTGACDAGIIVSGRWGTLNEFTNLYDMGKIIGVLSGSGGIADKLEGLTSEISKKTDAQVVFDTDPRELIKKVFKLVQQRK